MIQPVAVLDSVDLIVHVTSSSITIATVGGCIVHVGPNAVVAVVVGGSPDPEIDTSSRRMVLMLLVLMVTVLDRYLGVGCRNDIVEGFVDALVPDHCCEMEDWLNVDWRIVLLSRDMQVQVYDRVKTWSNTARVRRRGKK